MPTFLHAADLHLDSPLKGLERRDDAPVERLRGASRVAFDRLVTAAIARKVAFVVLVGDLYDTQPRFETYLFFQEQVKRLGAAGIPVAIVLGNHDHAGVSPRAGRLPDHVRVLSSDQPESLEIVTGVVVHGQSYPVRDVGDDLTKAYPRPTDGKLNIGLLHTALDGHSGEHERYAPSNTVALSNHGYQYWALGHVHVHTALVEKGVHLAYPGNLQGRHVKETGPKGAVFVDYTGTRIDAVRHEAFDDVRWHHVHVDAATLGDSGEPDRAIVQRVRDETAQARNAGKLAAVRVSVDGEAPKRLLELGEAELRASLLAAFAGDTSVYLEKVRLDIHPAPADRGEAERQLELLVESIAGAPEGRLALSNLAEDVRTQLRKTDPSLADLAPFVGRRSEPLTEVRARAQLDSALGLVRDLLRGKQGRS